MNGKIGSVVILGGGTAGWLSACYLAAHRPDLSITLVEAPDIPTIGVGEGTWPTMRGTLASIGISETRFITECEVSFKQGSRFDGWVTGASDDSYLHPFTSPPSGNAADLIAAWRKAASGECFAEALTPQAHVCAKGLAPRQRNMPDFAAATNYAYHLDAGKFGALLARHATERLGVRKVTAHIRAVVTANSGDITGVEARDGKIIEGDLFIDCSGQSAVLIGGHFGVPWIDRSDVSFNDRALAVQVPVQPDSAIASQTIGTAHEAGWLWDIALPTRRGIGCVYSSRFLSDERAEEILRDYVAHKIPRADPDALAPRRIAFSTGHREHFWHRNCLAIGLSAGFIEPLEASAIVLIELSLKALTENFPATRATMDIHARRFNELFRYRWDRIVDFLKLHYVLSEREEPYWRAQRDPQTVPPSLAEQLELWREQPPSSWDFPQIDEIFSAPSQQYVLYGMGFPVPTNLPGTPSAKALARIAEVREQARALTSALPTNRAYLDNLATALSGEAQKEATA